MGRTYAGILGLTAFTTLVARGVLGGGSLESTLRMASGGLFVFAAIGFVAGHIAASIVSDSVRAKFAAELQAVEPGANRK